MNAIARRRAGADQIPGQQSHEFRQRLDESRAIEDHVIRAFILHDTTIVLESNVQFLRVADEGGRYQ